MSYTPRPYQEKGYNDVLNAFSSYNKVNYVLPTGGGKCHGKDTPIMMFDGTIKLVQDVKENDLLMGNDSTPRKVLSLARGKEELFKITPIKGESFVVNRSHILSLKVTGIKTVFHHNKKKYKGGDIFNISVNDYLELTKHQKHLLKGYRVAVDFEQKELTIDPYFLGLWLGDGDSSSQKITTGDIEIENYLLDYANSMNLSVSYVEEKGNCKGIRIHNNYGNGCKGSVHNKPFKDLDLYNNKHIPLVYKTASRSQRLSLLAGLLDSDGHNSGGKGFDVVLKSERLMDGLIYLCRSLGFSAYKTKCIKTIKSINFSGEYFRTCISGDFSDVPFLLERNKCEERKQIKSVLNFGFNIESLGVGDYYGFELDGNHLYLLGDFTVTHNTFLFTMIAQHFTRDLNKKVLILCHRSELVDQTITSLARIGVTSERVISKVRKLHHKSDVYVAMIETAHNRLNKDPDFFKDIGLIICDECHILIFNKVFSFFKDAKILGCTATPVLMQRITYWKCDLCRAEYEVNTECCGEECSEWSKPLTMSKFYDTIILGPSIKFLIDEGFLVPEISFIEKYVDENDLKIDSSTGDFTTKSQDEAFNKKEVMFNIVNNYKKYCLGKKTMIFTSSTKANLTLLEEFKEAGIENVVSYDSVNNKSKERAGIMDWFENTPDAVLVNTGVFTTGLDVTDIQCIILARATLSLSLFLQVVGRAGRTTTKIFKDSFIFIDGGGNIARHLEWSDDTRDWEKIFYFGIGEDKAKKMQLDQTNTCLECGMIYARSEKVCPNCGTIEEIPPSKIDNADYEDSILEPIKKIPPPNAEMIYKYTVSQGKDINFAFKILINKIIDMFIFYRVSLKTYENTEQSGVLDSRVSEMIRKCYFVLVSKKDIIPENWGKRTLNYLLNKVKEKLKIRYNRED